MQWSVSFFFCHFKPYVLVSSNSDYLLPNTNKTAPAIIGKQSLQFVRMDSSWQAVAVTPAQSPGCRGRSGIVLVTCFSLLKTTIQTVLPTEGFFSSHSTWNSSLKYHRTISIQSWTGTAPWRSGEQVQPGGPFQRSVDHRQSCGTKGHREAHDGEPHKAPRRRRPGHRVVRSRPFRLFLSAAAAEDGVWTLLSGR